MQRNDRGRADRRSSGLLTDLQRLRQESIETAKRLLDIPGIRPSTYGPLSMIIAAGLDRGRADYLKFADSFSEIAREIAPETLEKRLGYAISEAKQQIGESGGCYSCESQNPEAAGCPLCVRHLLSSLLLYLGLSSPQKPFRLLERSLGIRLPPDLCEMLNDDAYWVRFPKV